MEEDFPRGSISARSTRLGDQKRRSFVQLGEKRAIDDVLFKDSEQETPSKGKKKKKTKKTDSGETEESKLDEELTETEGALPKPLTAKTITEGMLVLAVIQEIHEYEIVLSLPNGLTAFVQITDVSSFFTRQLQELNESSSADDQDLPNIQDLYQVGNLVPCKIKSLSSSKDGHWRIQASLDYKEINSELGLFSIKQGMTLHGCVSSVEDHGYSIDLGIQGTNVFLSKADTAKGAQGRKGEVLKTGKLVTCVVKAVKSNGRSILLAIDRERLRSSKATKNTNTTLSSLQPGTKLDALVTKILPNSLIVDVFGLYKGCVDPVHLRDTADKPTKYEIGQKLTAVVIYNCPTTKSIGLSLNPVHQKTTFDPLVHHLAPGDIVEDALVLRVQEKENLIVQLNTKTRGIVYHSHGSDDKQKRYNPAIVGEKVRCRILNFNVFDGLAIVSMRKSILDKPFLGINDVKPGMLVSGVIESVMPRGVAVKIQDRIHGFVPRTHLADIPVQKPQERFTIGSEIELRVLVVEPAKRRVLLTHKKTMVKSNQPIIASYTQPKVGMWVHGCVVAVKDFGCIVSFYNEVKGIIPRTELGMDESSLPMDNFFIGQVVKCRVMKTHDPEMKKLSLSLRQDGTRERDAFEAGKAHPSSTSRTSDLQLPSREPAVHDKQMSEMSEENDPGLKDRVDSTTQTHPIEIKKMIKSKNDVDVVGCDKKSKALEIDRDSALHIDYFQEIAESLKAFACMMMDVKVIKVEMKSVKQMLQGLSEMNRINEERKKGNGLKYDQEESRSENIDGEKTEMVKETEPGDGGREEIDRNEISEGIDRALEEKESCSNGQDVDVTRKEFDDIFGDDSSSDGECLGFDTEEIDALNVDRMLDDVGEDEEVTNGRIKVSESDAKGMELEECSNLTSTENTEKSDVSTRDPLGLHLQSRMEADGTDYRKDRVEKEEVVDGGVLPIDVERSVRNTYGNAQERNQGIGGDIIERCVAWEPLSEGEINLTMIKSKSRENFATNVLRKLVSPDILKNSNCYGTVFSNSRRQNVHKIDPGILSYVLDTTYEVYGVVEESEKMKLHRSCVKRIDSFCRQPGSNRQAKSRNKITDTRLDSSIARDQVSIEDIGLSVKGGSWKPLSEEDINLIKARSKSKAVFAKNVVKRLVSPDILAKSNCYGVTSQYRPNVQRIDPEILSHVLKTTCEVYSVEASHKREVCMACVASIDNHCRRLIHNSRRFSKVGTIEEGDQGNPNNEGSSKTQTIVEKGTESDLGRSK